MPQYIHPQRSAAAGSGKSQRSHGRRRKQTPYECLYFSLFIYERRPTDFLYVSPTGESGAALVTGQRRTLYVYVYSFTEGVNEDYAAGDTCQSPPLEQSIHAGIRTFLREIPVVLGLMIIVTIISSAERKSVTSIYVYIEREREREG